MADPAGIARAGTKNGSPEQGRCPAGRAGALRALRGAPAALRGAPGRGGSLLQRRARPAREALMDAPVRYPELFLATGDGTPQSYWTSLRYFNLYRVALAALFFGIALVYG